MSEDLPLTDSTESRVLAAYRRIHDAFEAAVADGVNVFVGGDPAVVQVTLGKESYKIRTERAKKAPPPPGPPAAPPPATTIVEAAKAMGYTGSLCDICGSARMIRSGPCEKCESCGSAGGCG